MWQESRKCLNPHLNRRKGKTFLCGEDLANANHQLFNEIFRIGWFFTPASIYQLPCPHVDCITLFILLSAVWLIHTVSFRGIFAVRLQPTAALKSNLYHFFSSNLTFSEYLWCLNLPLLVVRYLKRDCINRDPSSEIV